MRPNKLRELLRAGKPTLGTRVMSPWPTVIEVLGQAKQYDYVEFLAEYSPSDLHDLDNLCRAAELADLTPIIKIDQAACDYVAQRAIGAGFQLDLGVRHFNLNVDLWILLNWWTANGKTLREKSVYCGKTGLFDSYLFIQKTRKGFGDYEKGFSSLDGACFICFSWLYSSDVGQLQWRCYDIGWNCHSPT